MKPIRIISLLEEAEELGKALELAPRSARSPCSTLWSRCRSSEKTTAAASNGVPSWNCTPWRIFVTMSSTSMVVLEGKMISE